MKSFKKLLLVILILPCVFLFNGCQSQDKALYVTDIVQTETLGNKTTYTVYYSNGSTSLFTMDHGKDGQNGADLTLASIKEYCQENSIDFDSFLQEYLTIEVTTPTVQDATNKALLSAVTIWCEQTSEDFYHNKDLDLICGAGVIYKMGETYSYVLTNYHVVYYSGANTSDKIARKITLFQYGTSQLAYTTQQKDAQGYPKSVYGYGAVDATFVGGSLSYDLAVLRVRTDDLKYFNPHAKAATIANNYAIGETAIAVGNPACEGFSVTSGIISVESEEIEMEAADEATICTHRVLRMDTSINGGNSGGGLFNINGHLIGIVNAKVTSPGIDNIAYALPHDNVVAVADNLIYYFENTNTAANPKKLVLGITTEAQNMHAEYDPETNRTSLKEDIVIVQMELGVASSIGLQLGDKLLSITINDTTYTLNKQYQIGDLLLKIRPGDKFYFTVNRNGNLRDFGITDSNGVLYSQLRDVL